MTETSLAHTLLLASPVLSDSFFQESVILMIEDEEEGAIGFVLNHPLEVRLKDLSSSLGLSIRREYQDKFLHLGGPVSPERGWVVVRRNADTPSSLKISFETPDGLLLLTNMQSLQHLLITPNQEFKMMLGYAGWGSDQLKDELKEGAWLPFPYDSSLVFDPRPSLMWKKVLKQHGFGESMRWASPIRDD